MQPDPTLGFKDEKGISLFFQCLTTGVKVIIKSGRDVLECALGWRWIKLANIDKVQGVGARCLG
jgi:hypothetical protein